MTHHVSMLLTVAVYVTMSTNRSVISVRHYSIMVLWTDLDHMTEIDIVMSDIDMDKIIYHHNVSLYVYPYPQSGLQRMDMSAVYYDIRYKDGQSGMFTLT